VPGSMPSASNRLQTRRGEHERDDEQGGERRGEGQQIPMPAPKASMALIGSMAQPVGTRCEMRLPEVLEGWGLIQDGSGHTQDGHGPGESLCELGRLVDLTHDVHPTHDCPKGTRSEAVSRSGLPVVQCLGILYADHELGGYGVPYRASHCHCTFSVGQPGLDCGLQRNWVKSTRTVLPADTCLDNRNS
jgi:hypothetical protein